MAKKAKKKKRVAANRGNGVRKMIVKSDDTKERKPVRLVDFVRENEEWRRKLRDELHKLESIGDANLSRDQKTRRDALRRTVDKPVVDPLALVLNHELGRMVNKPELVALDQNGFLESQRANPPCDFTAEERRFAAVYGLLILDNTKDVGFDPVDILEGKGRHRGSNERFTKSWIASLGEYEGRNEAIFNKTLDILIESGDISDALIESQWTRVSRRLIDEKRHPSGHNFPIFVQAYYTEAAGATDKSPYTHVDISLPDLEAETDQDIQVHNLHAMQAIYFSAMLEELKLFQVTDKLLEQYHYGMLPLGRGNAGQELYSYWKGSQDRLTEMERRSLYARTLGMVGGEPVQGNANREFQNLWMRFLSAISTFYRQLKVDSLIRTAIPVGVHQEQVRKAGRDLASNLSLHGYGVAYYAAVELQKHIADVLRTLGQPELLASYGARDVWQLIDQVASLELGGARNSVRYRTMAQSGSTIIRWLADKRVVLSGYSTAEALVVDHLLGKAISSDRPMDCPTDYDLVNAVEQWLAVNGIPDQQVETYSQPYEPPPTTSAPVHIPAAARDVLDAYGIQAGRGEGVGSRLPRVIEN